MVWIAKRGMVLTLFFIGASLSCINQAGGVKPLLQAIVLWIVISVSSLFVVLETV